MVLVHDDDLAQLHGIYDGTVSRSLCCTPIMTFILSSSQPIESIQPDAMFGLLQRSRPKIHEVPFDLGKRPHHYYYNFFISYGGARNRKICRLSTMAGVLVQKLFG